MLGATDPGLLAATEAYRFTLNIFSENETLNAYLEVEKALAKAEVRAGIVPQDACDVIDGVCRLDDLDLEELRRSTARVGYPIVPLVDQLATKAGDAGHYLHLGATTQDVMDTALAIQIKKTAPIILCRLKEVCEILCDLAALYRDTIITGRSKLQHALPVTFGYKVAVWLDQLDRQRRAVQRAYEAANVVQFGGAVGTLAALGGAGIVVRAYLAEELGMAEPDITWHVSRDRFANLVHALAMTNACLGKIAVDVIHLMSTEVGELTEPFAAGRGTSSTMPQKRNPVLCEAILEAAHAAREGPSSMLGSMIQEHERAVASAYIERRAVANALMLVAGAADLSCELLAGLEVNTVRMTSNLEITNGLAMAESATMLLARQFGRHGGHQKLIDACREVKLSSRSLRTVLLEQEAIAVADLDLALDPARYLGAASEMIDCVTTRSRRD